MATEGASSLPESKENIADTVLDLIGNTPLVRLNVLTKDSYAEVVAKLESRNPTNSVKDRIAYSMIKAAEERGEISPDRTTLVEITSGNTGIGLALVAAIKGYKLIIVMPEYYSLERRVVIKAFGAQVIVTPAAKAVPGAVAKGAEILKKLGPNGWLVDQVSRRPRSMDLGDHFSPLCSLVLFHSLAIPQTQTFTETPQVQRSGATQAARLISSFQALEQVVHSLESHGI